MEVPTQTAEIFKILSKGQFINSNSSDKKMSDLYKVIEDEQNFENLHDYFLNINFVLEKGNEYFYFSRPESKTDLEKKIETAHKWIDIVDFMKTYRNDFSSGVRFSPSNILVQLKTDADLETKLEGLKKYADKDTQRDILERILKILADDSFIEIENSITQEYKVLASFHYLEQLILTINIPEDVKNEISE
ncbi:MAG: hypothetical protein LBQ28_10070 [Prevotellaceae bacterium]|jgi:hypothetical protein|nr:hypothetical protein [Prevotellaceae bacterium]